MLSRCILPLALLCVCVTAAQAQIGGGIISVYPGNEGTQVLTINNTTFGASAFTEQSDPDELLTWNLQVSVWRYQVPLEPQLILQSSSSTTGNEPTLSTQGFWSSSLQDTDCVYEVLSILRWKDPGDGNPWTIVATRSVWVRFE